ncbi:hypothetical protein WJX73_001251 [Symbiochloris irregularis]|uniref:GRIP domain-containing protein n=1 Tax=Symbiochloris irregularis TaxID=706552 RepID=A0AAW1PQQ5_9CHLO
MSRFWQSRLQETVGKTVTGFSESAARFKQGWTEPGAGQPPASPSSSTESSAPADRSKAAADTQQQFLRLPIESARKLRWYDREDLRPLVESNLKDKQLLHETIVALQQVLQEAGVPESAWKDHVEETDRLAGFDDANGSEELLDLHVLAMQIEEERKGSAALLAKLTRVERERREHVDELAELGTALDGARAQVASLQQELSTARQQHSEAMASSEQRLQELRAKVVANSTGHAEMLRRAQDICAESEERAGVAERRAEKAEARATRAEADLKDSKAEAKRLGYELKVKLKEAEQATAKAKAAEASMHEALLKRSNETEKGDALTSTLASVRKAAEEQEQELRRQLRDTEERLYDRIHRAEAEATEYRTAATAALSQLENLDQRAANAEAALEGANADLHAAEQAAAERDAAEAQCAVLRERLEERRGQHDQLVNYKQIAAKLEEEKARVEEEVFATARIATSLEARLRTAQAAQEAASAQAAAALQQAADAERRMEREVARRIEAAAADEASWPQAAREEMARLTQRLEASRNTTNGLQAELEAEVAAHEADAIARASLQMRLTAAEDRATRAERDARERTLRLERQASQARAEADEWRREAAAAEISPIEKRLSRQRSGWPAMQRQSSFSSLTPGTPRRGGGSLLGDEAASDDGSASWRGPPNRQGSMAMVPQREQLGGVDIVYLKNVVLKFLDAQASGRTDQSEALLPAVATLLRATPQEYRALKTGMADKGHASWWPTR